MARVNKAEARKVRCPRCQSEPGQPCKRRGSVPGEAVVLGDRHHKERIRAAKERKRA